MNNELVKIGEIEATYTRAGNVTGYRVELSHSGLNKHKLLRAPTRTVLQNMAMTQIASWKREWDRIVAKANLEKLSKDSKEEADRLTDRANKELDEAHGLLAASLQVSHAVNWHELEDRSQFRFDRAEHYPRVKFAHGDQRPLHPKISETPREPSQHEFPPVLNLLDKLILPLRRKREAKAANQLSQALATWRQERDHAEQENGLAANEYSRAQQEYDAELRVFRSKQDEANNSLADLKKRYEAGDPSAISATVEIILNMSRYPDWVPKESSCAYNPDNRTLFIDFALPNVDSLPSVVRVTYVASRNEPKITRLSDVEKGKLFDSVLYQIALRSLHETFGGDVINAIDAVVFNGWATWINKATGVEERGCLLSVQAMRSEFSAYDLSRVDPKECFRKLKGVSAAKLSGLTPVPPIARMNTSDPRFVASHEVADKLSEGVNLASIDWLDFEHLVREIFEKEFAGDGGEVKVTQASSDGGVDAVAFDPDPIRGGKIVIQAKRYTATVSVSAVRDLYGTMLNEGAMKGILVTTSDYGPDSYNFAKDKPITLLTGGNLLELLGRHGHKARIDLAEARRLREEAR